MKGQHLFVRQATGDDFAALEGLCKSAGHRPGAASGILLGKLAGSCVAAIYYDVGPDSILLRDLVVAPDLRKKRVGSGMLIELARLGRSLGKAKIVTDLKSCPFFQKTGFTDDGGLLRKSIEGE